MRRRAEQDNIDFGDQLLVRIDARETVIVVDGKLVFGLVGQSLLGEFERIGKSIGQRRATSSIVGFERVENRASPTPTATHQTDFDDVATLSMHAWDHQAAGRYSAGCGHGRLQKITARSLSGVVLWRDSHRLQAPNW